MTGSSALPSDRGHIRTEHRNDQSSHLDTLSTRGFINLMADDHLNVSRAIGRSAGDLGRFIDALVPRMRQGGRLIYVGAGTSGRLGVLDASECPPTFQSDPGQVIGIIAGGDASLRKSSEGREDEPDGAAAGLNSIKLTDRDTVLGIAAGGTTPYVLGALRLAKAAGAATGLLTCTPIDPAPGHCDHLIHLDTGPEVLTGSTRLKAGSATKLALNIITTGAFIQLGKVYSNLMVDLRATNAKLRDRAIRILIELCPDLSRENAASLLHLADDNVKAAIVMHRKQVDRDAAMRLLASHGGSLRGVIDPDDEP